MTNLTVKAFLIISIVIAYGSLSANGLMCYQCVYSSIPNDLAGSSATCQGPNVGSEHLITCDANQPFCQTIIAENSVVTLINRTCSQFGGVTIPCLNIAALGIVTIGCGATCNTNGCNQQVLSDLTGGAITITSHISSVVTCILVGIVVQLSNA